MYKHRTAQHRVEIYIATVAPDGYGGNTIDVDSLLTTRWASIGDVNSNQLNTEAGLKEFNDTYKFTFHYDSNLVLDAKKHTLKYGGEYFSILSIKTDGFRKVSQTVTAKKIFDD